MSRRSHALSITDAMTGLLSVLGALVAEALRRLDLPLAAVRTDRAFGLGLSGCAGSVEVHSLLVRLGADLSGLAGVVEARWQYALFEVGAPGLAVTEDAGGLA